MSKDTESITMKCPSCGWRTLFIGSGGYITCGNVVDCKEPDTEKAIENKLQKARWQGAIEATEAYLDELKKKQQAQL
jgi:hypothetical protein